MKKKSFTCIEDSLIDLYVNTKERVYNKSQKSDLELLKKQNPILIVDYISSLINLLFEKINLQNEQTSSGLINKEQNRDNESECECNSIYEKLLQEHESTIRQHIKLEYQLKLQNEAYVTKIDELERKIGLAKESKTEVNSAKSENHNLIITLNKEISHLKKHIESLNSKIIDQDKLIKQLKSKNEIDVSLIEAKYKEKFDLQQKRIDNLESSAYTNKITNDGTSSSNTKTNISLTKNPSYRVSNPIKSSKQIKNICLYISNDMTQDNIAAADRGSIDSLQSNEIIQLLDTQNVIQLLYNYERKIIFNLSEQILKLID